MNFVKELKEYGRETPSSVNWLQRLPFLRKYNADQGLTSTCSTYACTFAVSVLHMIETTPWWDCTFEQLTAVKQSQWVLSVKSPVNRIPEIYKNLVKTSAMYEEDEYGYSGLRFYDVFVYGIEYGYTYKCDEVVPWGVFSRRNKFDMPSSLEVPRVYIDDFQKMGHCFGPNKERIFIAADQQVLVGMLWVTPTFMNCKDIYYGDRDEVAEATVAHAVAIIGYDKDMDCLLIFNSWGKNWGIPEFPGCLWVKCDQMFNICRPLKSSKVVENVDRQKVARPRPPRKWKNNVGWGDSLLPGCSVIDTELLCSVSDTDFPESQPIYNLALDATSTNHDMNYRKQKVLDATSDKHGAPHNSLLAIIAESTRTRELSEMIIATLMGRLDKPSDQKWRSIYKTLVVLEYLVAHGSAASVEEIIKNRLVIWNKIYGGYEDSTEQVTRKNVIKKMEALVTLLESYDRIDELRNEGAMAHGMYYPFHDFARSFG